MGNAEVVPPKPSNFLQRVGRAGRRVSALVLNYAHSGEPHDMYYFNYPDEMMEGRGEYSWLFP